MHFVLGTVFFLLVVDTTVFARIYNQVECLSGQGFLDAFEYQSIEDPTHGRVNYVDSETAAREKLTYVSGGHFIMRADSTKRLNPNGPGRDSVRLQSRKQYTTSVMVFNIYHMPVGCGTWPAVWTNGANWPYQGEIDILEGANDVGPNQVTLHTGPGCTMPASRHETGYPAGDNCDSVNSNYGCGVKLSDPRSFSHDFNRNGGGWYVVERTSDFIKVWFWSRSSAPSDVKNGESQVDTDHWGAPGAYFPSTSCSIAREFGPHNIMLDLTFCGDLAGNAYRDSGCPLTCVDFVNNNPAAFHDAYFDFEWLKIYT
ncbi:hypothetical protein APHAL10511_006707 [Amanita phalloides]|nr:hypothetical protein APHAL10511_006707 [Amanita phalloides]